MKDIEILLTYWYGIPSIPNERLDKIQNSGFNSLSLHWCNDYEESNGKKEDIMKICNQKSMEIKIFHLPFEQADKLWKSDLEGERLFEIYKNCIRDAGINNIKYVVMHLNYNDITIDDENIGISRLVKLLEFASKFNVKIAFENLAEKDNLEIVVPLIRKYSNACFCFDVGHNNINYSNVIMQNKDKIEVMHIHDNFGKKDNHQIPFTGNVDWNSVYEIIIEVINHCELVLEVQDHSDKNEQKFLDDVYLASKKIKSEIRKRVKI